MRISPISHNECSELLKRVSVGRLGCSLDNQPYVVPVRFSYEPDCIYIFSTVGQKIKWMRQNPRVCLQADEIGNSSNWLSVIVTGTYLELSEPQYHTAQREHARELLAQHPEWWRIPLSEARDRSLVSSIETVFFRIDIKSMSGLRAMPEGVEGAH
jgi:nitroimidazol reductase NimA-like FMN-containing flavoprotein (pyridoxamine 5'-phosphate oxidase superfamily)